MINLRSGYIMPYCVIDSVEFIKRLPPIRFAFNNVNSVVSFYHINNKPHFENYSRAV